MTVLLIASMAGIFFMAGFIVGYSERVWESGLATRSRQNRAQKEQDDE